MVDHALGFIMAFSALFLWAVTVKMFLEALLRWKFKEQKAHRTRNTRTLLKAKKLIQEDPRVKKVYVALRVLYLKNKNSEKVDLLEQQLRLLVREKALRQEILFLIRAKNSRK